MPHNFSWRNRVNWMRGWLRTPIHGTSGVPEPAHGLVRQLCPSLSNSAVSDFKLVVLNYLWWDYLHYGTRPRIHIRTPSMPPRKPVKHLSAAYYWVIYITLTNNNTYYATFVKKLPTVQETEAMATHSSILTWRIPMDRRAWQATVHGVTKSWTQLNDWAYTVLFMVAD